MGLVLMLTLVVVVVVVLDGRCQEMLGGEGSGRERKGSER